MADVLTADQLAEGLATLPAWSGDVSGIERAVKAPSFLDGIRLVDAVADAAEAADHHPDIDIRYTDITFRLSTHSAGGVTEKDLELAARINELAELATDPGR